MKLFHFGKDGGPDSTVWGFWPIEIKSLFSVALLCFEDGSREAFHSHAFNSTSWVLSGGLREEFKNGTVIHHPPSTQAIYTTRDDFHRVSSVGRSWVLTFRGPWADRWNEWFPKTNKLVTLESGRKVIDESNSN